MDYTIEEILHAFGELTADEKNALTSIIKEYNRARLKHPGWPIDIIHAAGIVAEESGELMRAALQFEYEGGAKEEIFNEATHTGAMAFRLLVEHL